MMLDMVAKRLDPECESMLGDTCRVHLRGVNFSETVREAKMLEADLFLK